MVFSHLSPSARLEQKIGAGYPCRPHFFLAQIDYLFKCYAQLKYAENSITSVPLRVPKNSRRKTKPNIPVS